MDPMIHSKNNYFDISQMTALKTESKKDPSQSIKQVAKQFESVFLNMMMQSMRKANEVFSENSFLHSQTTDFYMDMFDKQLSTTLSQGKGLGLADVLERQLSGTANQINRDQTRIPQSQSVKNVEITPAKAVSIMKPEKPEPIYQIVQDAVTSIKEQFTEPNDFVKSLLPAAKWASQQLGISPSVLIAQAALETGWGKHIIHSPEGESSHNLFNIKSNSGDKTKQINVATIEYKEGIAVKLRQHFKAYDTIRQSFEDYVNLIKSHDRYDSVLENTDNPYHYLHALQKAGYATDPDYANKIIDILKHPAIQQTLIDNKEKML